MSLPTYCFDCKVPIVRLNKRGITSKVCSGCKEERHRVRQRNYSRRKKGQAVVQALETSHPKPLPEKVETPVLRECLGCETTHYILSTRAHRLCDRALRWQAELG